MIKTVKVPCVLTDIGAAGNVMSMAIDKCLSISILRSSEVTEAYRDWNTHWGLEHLIAYGLSLISTKEEFQIRIHNPQPVVLCAPSCILAGVFLGESFASGTVEISKVLEICAKAQEHPFYGQLNLSAIAAALFGGLQISVRPTDPADPVQTSAVTIPSNLRLVVACPPNDEYKPIKVARSRLSRDTVLDRLNRVALLSHAFANNNLSLLTLALDTDQESARLPANQYVEIRKTLLNAGALAVTLCSHNVALLVFSEFKHNHILDSLDPVQSLIIEKVKDFLYAYRVIQTQVTLAGIHLVETPNGPVVFDHQMAAVGKTDEDHFL